MRAYRSGLYLLFTLLYWQLSHPRFLKRLLRSWRVLEAIYLWLLRLATLTTFILCVWCDMS